MCSLVCYRRRVSYSSCTAYLGENCRQENFRRAVYVVTYVHRDTNAGICAPHCKLLGAAKKAFKLFSLFVLGVTYPVDGVPSMSPQHQPDVAE